MLESRPDIVNTISGMVQGGQPAVQEQRIELSKDEFDPWEAYNDPSSKSYKYRQQELQDSINQAVQSQVGDVKKEVGISKLQTELANRGLNSEQINSFMDFASKNPAEYGIDDTVYGYALAISFDSKDIGKLKKSKLEELLKKRTVTYYK